MLASVQRSSVHAVGKDRARTCLQVSRFSSETVLVLERVSAGNGF